MYIDNWDEFDNLEEGKLSNFFGKIKASFQNVLFRKDLDINYSKDSKGRYRFYLVELPIEEAKKLKKIAEQRVATSPYIEGVCIENYNPEVDYLEFTFLYNKTFAASPDPSRPITYQEAKKFPADKVFIVKLWGAMAGFVYVTIEPYPLNQEKIAGVIAGIGVLPKHRGKKLGSALIAKAIDYFIQHKVDYVIAEVYEKNKPSLKMFLRSGFKITGETFFTKTGFEEYTPIKNQ